MVSKGYQRLFADGERIQLVAKQTTFEKTVGVGDAFVVDDFHTVFTEEGAFDHIEDEWTRLESFALPLVRRVIAGDRSRDALLAVKVLAVVHFVRSYGFREVFDRVFEQAAPEQIDRLVRSKKVRRAFRRAHGREPAAHELRRLGEDSIADMRSDNWFFVERLVSSYAKAFQRIDPLHVQIVEAVGPIDFITGDVPTVITDGLRVGVAQGLALGDATSWRLPLSPRVTAVFTTGDDGHGRLSPMEVQAANNLVWRGALRHVACHPNTDWRRALGGSPPARR